MMPRCGVVRVHANLIQMLASKAEPMTSDTSGLSGSDSSRQDDHLSSSESKLPPPWSSARQASNRLQARLNQDLRQEMTPLGSTLFSLTWKERVTPAQRHLSAQQVSGHRTSGSESSLVPGHWPTTTTKDGIGPNSGSGSMKYPKTATHHVGVTLTDAAKMTSWATPTTRDHKDGASDGTAKENSLLGRQVWNLRGEIQSGFPAATDESAQLNPAHSRYLMGCPAVWDYSSPGWEEWTTWQAFLASRLKQQKKIELEDSVRTETQSSPMLLSPSFDHFFDPFEVDVDPEDDPNEMYDEEYVSALADAGLVYPRRLPALHTIEDIERQGGYRIIEADPCWSYRQGGRGAARNHYETAKFADIAALPVKRIAAENAILFCWVTFPIWIDDPMSVVHVIDSWGFKPKTIGFLWVKRNKNSGTPFWGGGSWSRANAEVCLLCTRGKVSSISASVHQLVEEWDESEFLLNSRYNKVHSSKPAEVRDRIVTLCGDLPRIELYARDRTPGWAAWGDDPKLGYVDVDLSVK